MKLRAMLLSVLCTVLVTFAIGCADEEPEPSPSDTVAADVEAMVGPVESALANPSGAVSADNVSDVFAALANQGTAGDALGYVPGSPGPTPQGGHQAECITATATGGTMDLGCLSGGEITGTVVYKIAVKGTDFYMSFTYDAVCTGDVCLSGTGAQKYSGDQTGQNAEIIMVGDFTVTEGGETHKLSYGFKMTITNGTDITLEYVVWVDGESYVVTYEVTADSWTATIKGANGSYTCTAVANGDGTWTGECSGDGSFTF